jgi:hypothetical protein
MVARTWRVQNISSEPHADWRDGARTDYALQVVSIA